MEHVFEKLERINIFEFSLFGYKIEISNNILVMWIVMAVLIIAALVMTRGLSVDKPGKRQRLAELLVEFVNGLCKDSIEHQWRAFVPFIGTMLLFLVLSNIITIFNFLPFVNLYPPTKDINVTGAMAVMAIAAVLGAALRYRGPVNWAKDLTKPTPVMTPFNVLEYGIRPLSLCLRLFGNVVAAFLIMELVMSYLPFLGAPLSAYFDLFDGILQAYIFVFLTTMYIGEAVEG